MAREEPQAKPDRQDSPPSRGAVVLVLPRVRWEVHWMLAQTQAKGMQGDGKVHDVRSTTKAKSGDAEKLKLLLLKALSVVMNEESDKDADME
jgi:hypothetical protein